MWKMSTREFKAYMMNDMIMSNIMKEETPLPAQEVSIDSSSGPTLKVPGSAAIVRKDGIGVVEVGDHDN